MPSPQPIKAPLFAYITDRMLEAVAVVDTATNAVVATVPLGGFPGGIVSSPDGNIFITIPRGLEDNTGFIAILDPASHTIVARIPVATEIGPEDIVITPDGARAYATGADKVFVVDTAAKTVIATVPIVDPATAGAVTADAGIAISPDGKHVYVANFNLDKTVSVVATATNAVVAKIQTSATRIAVAPDGKHAYLTNEFPTVRVLDTATNTISATIVVANTSLDGVAFSPDGKHAYIVGTDDNQNLFDSVGKMVVIDTATNTVEHAVPIPHTSLFGVAVSPDGKHAYFVGEEQVAPASQPTNFVGHLEVFDTATNTGAPARVGISLRRITLGAPALLVGHKAIGLR
jgi:YVTN family beta-propeller protein